MNLQNFAWGEMFKGLYRNGKVRIGIFFLVSTYIILVQAGFGQLFSLLILIPSSAVVAMVFFFIFEMILLPLYKWLTGGK